MYNGKLIKENNLRDSTCRESSPGSLRSMNLVKFGLLDLIHYNNFCELSKLIHANTFQLVFVLKTKSIQIASKLFAIRTAPPQDISSIVLLLKKKTAKKDVFVKKAITEEKTVPAFQKTSAKVSIKDNSHIKINKKGLIALYTSLLI